MTALNPRVWWRIICAPSTHATARGWFGAFVRWCFQRSGHYAPIPAREKTVTQISTVAFRGDAPVQIAGGVLEQGRMAFREKRSVQEHVNDLIVTPLGAAWAGGRLCERYSAAVPGLRTFFAERKPRHIVGRGVYIQAAHKDTYGDWVSEYLGALALADPLDAPLFLPAEMAARPYVVRDLEAAGVPFVAIDKPVLIQSALVLRQQKYFVHFDKADVAALERFLGVDKSDPKPGSLVYLSRRNDISEVANRAYPHDIVERFVKQRGGCVLHTAETAGPEEYQAAALDAETVVFDHGSAFYNALYWRPKRVVEIVSDSWWNNAFLMLANAMGVKDYTIIRGDLSEAHVTKRLNEALDRPLDP